MTLIGIVTYGNPHFTALALREIHATVRSPHRVCVIIGKPGDTETLELAQRAAVIRSLMPAENDGFPFCLNELMELAWVAPGHASLAAFDNLIFMGNDVVPYPGAIDAMIRAARETDYEWLCASQYDVRSLVRDHPEAARDFGPAPDFVFADFTKRPWDAHADFREPSFADGHMTDIRNLALCKRSAFDKVGFADVNFWPGGYFEDNDYHRRCQLAGIRVATLPHAAYFHFWSRTIHQGDGTRSDQFERNRGYYCEKWGGAVNEEQLAMPFATHPVAITSRAGEREKIEKWRELSR